MHNYSRYLLTIMAVLLVQIGVAASIQENAAKRADEYFQKQDWTNAITAYQAITAAEPQNVQAWYRLGYALQVSGQYTQAIEAYERMFAIRPNPIAPYNIACAYARLNNKERAYEWLEKAIAQGFAQIQTLASDEDLASLRGEARFEAIKKEMVARAQPCKSMPEARQFDFWIGEWDVKTATGQLAGTNTIQLILDDCVLLENWTSVIGGTGKSMNVYNAAKGKWQQTWIDSRGGVIEFVNGEYKDGAMRFIAETRGRDGSAVMRRLTFYNLGPDRVRQFSEMSTDGGKSWAPEYDFYYHRKK